MTAELIVEKLKKLSELATRGVGGEREVALRMLDKQKEKLGGNIDISTLLGQEEQKSIDQQIIDSISKKTHTYDRDIKSVFCSYRGILIVCDSDGNRVEELCGEMTAHKYRRIEALKCDDTEFDNIKNYEYWADTTKRDPVLNLMTGMKGVGKTASLSAKQLAQVGKRKVLVLDASGSTTAAFPTVNEAKIFLQDRGEKGSSIVFKPE